MTGAQRGLTLIELLVALALALIALFAASTLLISSTRSAGDLQVRSDLLLEQQVAQNYLLANVREAAFVYPSGTPITLPVNYSTTRPGGGTWTAGGSVPLLAFIQAPERPVSGCALTNADTRRACYTFRAYYPVRRADWVAGAPDPANPGPDAGNDDRWVLAEFAQPLNATTPPTVSGALNLAAAGLSGTASLLLDYVQQAAPGLPPLLSAVTPSPQTPGGVRVTLNVSLNRNMRGRDTTQPARPGASPASWVQSVTIAPRNVGTLPP